MADVMGSGGLAWYQWKKHGRCSGLPARDYFALGRRLYAALDLPRPDDGRATAAEDPRRRPRRKPRASTPTA